MSKLISRGPRSGTFDSWEASKLAGDSPRGAFPYWFTILEIWLSMDVKEGRRLEDRKRKVRKLFHHKSYMQRYYSMEVAKMRRCQLQGYMIVFQIVKSNFADRVLIVCLFGIYRPTREFFTHMETSPLSVKGCKILTYARHSWPLSTAGSLACHTYSDVGNPFIMVISDESWHLLPSVLIVELSLPVLRT